MRLKQRLNDHLIQIVRQRDPYLNSGGHFFVREYIRQTLAQWGEVEVHEFKFQGKNHQNLILNLNSASIRFFPNLDWCPLRRCARNSWSR